MLFTAVCLAWQLAGHRTEKLTGNSQPSRGLHHEAARRYVLHMMMMETSTDDLQLTRRKRLNDIWKTTSRSCVEVVESSCVASNLDALGNRRRMYIVAQQ